jgi:hypothetical protein
MKRWRPAREKLITESPFAAAVAVWLGCALYFRPGAGDLLRLFVALNAVAMVPAAWLAWRAAQIPTRLAALMAAWGGAWAATLTAQLLQASRGAQLGLAALFLAITWFVLAESLAEGKRRQGSQPAGGGGAGSVQSDTG